MEEESQSEWLFGKQEFNMKMSVLEDQHGKNSKTLERLHSDKCHFLSLMMEQSWDKALQSSTTLD